jgi:XXXCH domain-containing protein
MEKTDEYKQLKERMRADFKQIRKAVRKGKPLDAELVRAFCADARRMTTYPGKGDEYYPAFRDLVECLEKALEQGSESALADTVASIRRMEKACHKRYK